MTPKSTAELHAIAARLEPEFISDVMGSVFFRLNSDDRIGIRLSPVSPPTLYHRDRHELTTLTHRHIRAFLHVLEALTEPGDD